MSVHLPVTLKRAELAARRYRAAQARADELRESRDEMVVALSRGGIPHRVIAESVELSLPAVGKITRAGGILHWTRGPNRSTGRAA